MRTLHKRMYLLFRKQELAQPDIEIMKRKKFIPSEACKNFRNSCPVETAKSSAAYRERGCGDGQKPNA